MIERKSWSRGLSTGSMRFSISQGLAARRPVPHVPQAGFVHGQAQVAQLVEQRTENPRVGGSNPPLGTNFLL